MEVKAEVSKIDDDFFNEIVENGEQINCLHFYYNDKVYCFFNKRVIKPSKDDMFVIFTGDNNISEETPKELNLKLPSFEKFIEEVNGLPQEK